MTEEPQVVKVGILSLQVCVPAGWDDEQAWRFAEREHPCGTTNGWMMRRTGDEALCGKDERVNCASRPGYVHIMFDA